MEYVKSVATRRMFWILAGLFAKNISDAQRSRIKMKANYGPVEPNEGPKPGVSVKMYH